MIDIFSRKPDPSTAHLQKGSEKNPKTKELILPPVDENGFFVNDKSRQGMTLSEAINYSFEKRY